MSKKEISYLQEQLANIQEKLEKLDQLTQMKKSIDSFQRSITFINEQYESQKKELEEIKAKNDDLESKNTVIQMELRDLQEQMMSLSLHQDEADQYSRRNNLEITGVPFTAQESTENIVKKIAQVSNIEISSASIETCHRVPTRVKDKHQPIIVKFTNRKDRERFRQATRKQRLRVKDIYPNRDNTEPIYINEHLTPTRKEILRKVIEVKKQKKAKYVWTVNGIIFYKRNDNSDTIKLTQKKDLSKIGASI